MEFNWRYANLLEGCFSSYASRPRNVYITDTSLENNNVFNKFFIVDFSSDNLEIPVFARGEIEEQINTVIWNNHKKIDKFIIPLYVNGVFRSSKTIEPLIKEAFKNDLGRRLNLCTTVKGGLYYIGRGIILDKDLYPLFLLSLKGMKSYPTSTEKPVIKYIQPTVYVDPKVFINCDDLMNRYIIRKLMPFYLTHSIRTYSVNRSISDTSSVSSTPKIEIENLSRFVDGPITPDPQNGTNDKLNELLVDNIEDVLQYFE